MLVKLSLFSILLRAFFYMPFVILSIIKEPIMPFLFANSRPMDHECTFSSVNRWLWMLEVCESKIIQSKGRKKIFEHFKSLDEAKAFTESIQADA